MSRVTKAQALRRSGTSGPTSKYLFNHINIREAQKYLDSGFHALSAELKRRNGIRISDGARRLWSCQRNGEQRWGESNPTQLLNSSNPGGSGIMQVACVDCVCLTRYLFASQVGSGDYSTRTQLRTASLLESTQRVWCGRARGGTRQVGLLFGRVFCELDICVIASPACSSKVHFHPLTVSWLPNPNISKLAVKLFYSFALDAAAAAPLQSHQTLCFLAVSTPVCVAPSGLCHMRLAGGDA